MSHRYPHLVLASASPRRAELLRAANISFEVIVSPSEEPQRKPVGIPTELWPTCLAYMKATSVQHEMRRRKLKSHPVILAADTIVVLDGRILNKARDRTHARRMLSSLSGRTHQVVTGICLLSETNVRTSRAIATCAFKILSPRQLTAYLDSNLWQGKAGAYGIQDIPAGDPLVTLLSGEITTVIGLPVPLLLRELESFS